MMKIRDFLPGDIDAICAFKAESVKKNYAGCDFDNGIFRNILLRDATRNPGHVKVAEEDGRIRGYIWFREIESDVGKFGRIEHIFVDSAHRGAGLGKMLMKEAEGSMRAAGIKKVKLTVSNANSGALSLYRDAGYEEKGVRMEKEL